MTTTTEVTQADREAAANLVEWLTSVQKAEGMEGFFLLTFPENIRKGVWDTHEYIQAFAHHRIAALAQGRLEGVEAGLEAAIKAADKICDEAAEEGDDPDYDEGSVWASMATLSELRALDPTTIANQIGEK